MFKTPLSSIDRRAAVGAFASVLALAVWPVAQAQAAAAPDALVRQISTEVIDTVKADKDIQAGNLNKIIALVDAKVMPHVNFQRMTAIAVGRAGAQPRPSSKNACSTSSRPCWCAPIQARSRR